MSKEKNKCHSEEKCEFKGKGGTCTLKNGEKCVKFYPPEKNKIKKYTPEEARAIIQESVVKANQEINKIMKKYGLTFQVVHSIQIVPNVECNETNRKTNI